MDTPHGPLRGIRVLEFTGIGPAPYACLVLAELGADVLRIDRPGGPGPLAAATGGLNRSRPCVALDLKHPAATATALRLVAQADVLVEGLRPGVMERLGLGPEPCLAANPGLVYARMTGWGQRGPRADEVGHDITYAALAGALHCVGPADRPMPPVNLVADFGGGSMFLLVGILSALLARRAGGPGQVVDAAMCDGAASLLTMVYDMWGRGLWQDRREANLLDGGCPFYRTYACADGAHVAVGPLEPQFYAAFVAVLGLADAAPPHRQYDESTWPELTRLFEAAFAGRPRDAWLRAFAGTDACVVPVHALAEAVGDPHLADRGVFVDVDGVRQPRIAPVFSGTPTLPPTPPRPAGADTREGLLAWGLPETDVAALLAAGAAHQA